MDGVLGIRIRGRRKVGADETTELWRPLFLQFLTLLLLSLLLTQLICFKYGHVLMAYGNF